MYMLLRPGTGELNRQETRRPNPHQPQLQPKGTFLVYLISLIKQREGVRSSLQGLGEKLL
jgi:hypothetical protein